MEIVLHCPGAKNGLGEHYREAFENAVELYVLTAYLTDWDSTLRLNSGLERFRLIVGKDFGITRKKACRDVMTWLPDHLVSDFYVADQIRGFHPKAVFWRSVSGKTHMLVGSSNITQAAFETNVEANVYGEMTEREFAKAKEWVDWVASRSMPVSEDWLQEYTEAVQVAKSRSGKKIDPTAPVVSFKLPNPKNRRALLARRRKQLEAHGFHRDGLVRLFRRCAAGEITNADFYMELPSYWSHELDNRLQGQGWQIQGKGADFRELAKSFLAIVDAPREDRDDLVRLHLDRLEESRNPARKAFFTEMLSLHFPDDYHVLNKPVDSFLSANNVQTQRGASAGARYVDVAKKLRLALKSQVNYPARNLVELDHLIWAEYGD